jgi:hypothetical protein
MINTVEKIYDVLNQSNTYKVTYDNGIISFVPNNSANTDYQAIQKWIAEGGVVIDSGGN